jgi:uncharacterized protein (TIGR02246 family)
MSTLPPRGPSAGPSAPLESPAVPPEVQEQQRIEEELRRLVAEQTEAWNRHDAVAWSKDFAADARFINIFGMELSGRDSIEQRHADVFAGIFRNSKAQVTVKNIVRPVNEIALVDTEHEVTDSIALPSEITEIGGVLRTRMRYVLKKTQDKWVIIAGQNTDVKPWRPKR